MLLSPLEEPPSHVTFVLDEGVKKSIEIARIIREENERNAAANPQAETVGAEAEEAAQEDDEDENAEAGPADPNAPPTANTADGSTDRPKN